MSPSRVATAARSCPTARSIRCTAAARACGRVPSSVDSRPGWPASVSWSSETRVSGQPESTAPSAVGSVGSSSTRVIGTPGAATATVAARPDTVAQPTRRPSAPGSAPNRAVPSSAAVRATVACGSASAALAARSWRPQWDSEGSTGGCGRLPSVATDGARLVVGQRHGRAAEPGAHRRPGRARRARLPAPMVAQPSRMQVVERAPRTDMAPIDECSAIAHSSGVRPGSTSSQVRPGTPTTRTRCALASSAAARRPTADRAAPPSRTTSTAATRARRLTRPRPPARRAARGRRPPAVGRRPPRPATPRRDDDRPRPGPRRARGRRARGRPRRRVRRRPPPAPVPQRNRPARRYRRHAWRSAGCLRGAPPAP